MTKVIKHYGTPRRSGRYPWGSGGDPEQRNTSLSGYANELRGKGMSEKAIAESLGLSIADLRAKKSIEKSRQRAADTALALRLKDKGMSNIAIGERMNLNESSVRALMNPALRQRSEITKNIATMLKETVATKGVVDIGVGVEANLGISRTKLKTSVAMLKEEGYNVYFLKTQQLGTGKYTSIMVLAPPDMGYAEVYKNRADVKTITEHTVDGGRSFLGLKPVQAVSDSRVAIRYVEDGGGDKDGVIELRRGVDDLDLGASRYAQVRIAVGDKHYLKGMAIYSDNIPDGVDIVYNISKSKADTPKNKAMKTMDLDNNTGLPDPDNPFGTTIKPGGQRGALNIVNEEGDWGGWSRSISSQVLSKQSPALAKKQLGLSLGLKQEEFDEINSLTNPVVKKRLLEAFADDADSSAVHLKAAALPRQASHVLLPILTMKEKEIYAPMFRDGENVVLIRHPHGGVFEIPELIVNNKNQSAKSMLGSAIDAVGIHPSIAAKLSGADFDGDTVLVIPNDRGNIKTAPSLKALKDFDTRLGYPPHDGMKTIDGGVFNATTKAVDYQGKNPSTSRKQTEMGNISNLITDMTIKGATTGEIARAVKHSMVVIDAEKHHLNYKQSELDNGIAFLKETYQGGPRSGASTLVSRAKSEQRVDHRVEGLKILDPKTGKSRRIYIDPKTGEKLYAVSGEEYTTKDGKLIKRTTRSTKMTEAKSAFDLSSGTKMETIYAEHADTLKALANKARLAAMSTPNLKYSATAKKAYAVEVETLKAKIREAYRNKPLERQAQLAANAVYRAKLAAHPELDGDDKKRLRGQALIEARLRVGASKQQIDISIKEWNAIQAGAVSHNTVAQILQNTDLAKIKTMAMPRTAYVMTPAKVARAKSMASSGYTPAEIANALGVSTTSVVDNI